MTGLSAQFTCSSGAGLGSRMPELPEVECVRRSVEDRVLGAQIRAATVHRRDVVCRHDEPRGGWSRRGKAPKPTRYARIPRHELGVGATINAVHRRGKQLAIELDRAGALLVHLGMTGQLMTVAERQRIPQTDHVHITWRLADRRGRLVFRDPRRFGGVWLYPSMQALVHERWDELGEDALTIAPETLYNAFQKTARPVKAALLDQQRLAGVGNIYADECLFQARIHPEQTTNTLTRNDVDNLVSALTRILHHAIEAGGSTIRDYADSLGTPGSAQHAHAVYGRGGEPCRVCGGTLAHATVAQRTTVWCPVCQPNP